MDNNICKQVNSMISLYIDGKLNDEHKQIVEKHFEECPKCFEKYKAMKEVVENLKLSYERLLNEFEAMENANLFNIREYERFSDNLSAYMDNELSYEESVKFRKYLLKSKSARNDLTTAYKVKNAMQDTILANYLDNQFDFSKKIVTQLKKEDKKYLLKTYTKAAIIAGLLLFSTATIMISAHKQHGLPNFKMHKKLYYVEHILEPLADKAFAEMNGY
ncbi:MAG: zf-HC2 domain-containing protein [Candidatus Gastranaerophilales bacterium]|nr:zf-HC2 domain-containing protein [Candidatus Gastranaerophilales bacterium]